LRATRSSWSHGKYNPPLSPPQALKCQSTPRTVPRLFTTHVGPTSRIQQSSCASSTSRTLSPSSVRALLKWALETPMLTGSNRAMLRATCAKASCAGRAASRQLSGRSGHSIQQPACGSNSPGMRKPSAAGVLASARVIAAGGCA
jgi:hypothetical protein